MNSKREIGWFGRHQSHMVLLLSVMLCVSLLGVNGYRAATQSITIDEAYSYNQFVSKPASRMLEFYDAANHVLYTFLAKACVSMFGLSEFTLRLPSVLAGVVYFLAAILLSRLLFENPLWQLASVALLTLNPYVLDYLSMARGYGLALSFFLLGFWRLARGCGSIRASWGRQFIAGVLFGLAVASNLTLLYPVVGVLAAYFSITVIANRLSSSSSGVFSVLFKPNALLILGVFIPTAATLPAFKAASIGNFYVGESLLREGVRSLIDACFAYKMTLLIHALGWLPNYYMKLLPAAVVAVVAVSAGLAVTAVVRKRGPAEHPPLRRDQVLVCLTGLTILATFVAVVCSHHLFGVPWPVRRTGLYWIPLVTLACLQLLYYVRSVGGAAGLLSVFGGIVIPLSVAQFVLSFNAGYYTDYRQDAGSKRIFDLICSRPGAGDGRPVTVGAAWYFQDELEFYRQAHEAPWLEVAERGKLACCYDYYVMKKADFPQLCPNQLTAIYVDPIAESVLAQPGPELKRAHETRPHHSLRRRGRDQRSK